MFKRLVLIWNILLLQFWQISKKVALLLFCFCKSYTKPYLKKYQEFEDGPSEKKVAFFMRISNESIF